MLKLVSFGWYGFRLSFCGSHVVTLLVVRAPELVLVEAGKHWLLLVLR